MPKVNILKLKKVLIILGVIVGIILVALWVMDWQSRDNYAKVDKEAERIISLLPKASGVIKEQTPGGAFSGEADVRTGDGLINSRDSHCGIDVACPSSKKSRLVLIPRNHEDQFFNSLLKLSGYESGQLNRCYLNYEKFQSCMDIISNSQFSVYFTLEPADPYHHGVPAQDDGISAEVWRYVTISVSPKRN